MLFRHRFTLIFVFRDCLTLRNCFLLVLVVSSDYSNTKACKLTQDCARSEGDRKCKKRSSKCLKALLQTFRFSVHKYDLIQLLCDLGFPQNYF